MAKKIDYASLFTLRKDGLYEAKYTDAKGRHSMYGKDPEKLYYRLQDKLNSVAKMPTFKEVAELWEEEHVEKLEVGTRATYKAPLQKVVDISGDLLIDEVNAAEINRVLMAEKESGYSYKHAATVKSMYKQVLDFAIIKGYITVNPAMSVKVPRGMAKGKREAPEDETVNIIKANLDKPFGDFVALLLYTGMRTEEAVALRWGDVNMKSLTINIERAVSLRGTPTIKDTKTEAGTRTVPVLPPLKPYLQKPVGAHASDYIFNIDGKLLTRAQISSRWLNWCKSAGLAVQVEQTERHRGDRECVRHEWRPLVTPHQLRHNFATILFEAGVDELTAADLMGHTDISLTRAVYTSLRKKHRASQIQKLTDAFH